MSFDYQPVLNSDLIKIRPLRSDDYSQLFAIASDPIMWVQHPVKNRYEEENFLTFFNEAINSGGALIVIDAKTQKAIGSSRFHGYDKQTGEIEIGWTFLARKYWGGRYNREIKQLMLKHAFRSVRSVAFLVAPDNIRSQRAVEKIGGIRSGSRINGAGQSCYVYKIRERNEYL